MNGVVLMLQILKVLDHGLHKTQGATNVKICMARNIFSQKFSVYARLIGSEYNDLLAL